MRASAVLLFLFGLFRDVCGDIYAANVHGGEPADVDRYGAFTVGIASCVGEECKLACHGVLIHQCAVLTTKECYSYSIFTVPMQLPIGEAAVGAEPKFSIYAVKMKGKDIPVRWKLPEKENKTMESIELLKINTEALKRAKDDKYDDVLSNSQLRNRVYGSNPMILPLKDCAKESPKIKIASPEDFGSGKTCTEVSAVAFSPIDQDPKICNKETKDEEEQVLRQEGVVSSSDDGSIDEMDEKEIFDECQDSHRHLKLKKITTVIQDPKICLQTLPKHPKANAFLPDVRNHVDESMFCFGGSEDKCFVDASGQRLQSAPVVVYDSKQQTFVLLGLWAWSWSPPWCGSGAEFATKIASWANVLNDQLKEFIGKDYDPENVFRSLDKSVEPPLRDKNTSKDDVDSDVEDKLEDKWENAVATFKSGRDGDDEIRHDIIFFTLSKTDTMEFCKNWMESELPKLGEKDRDWLSKLALDRLARQTDSIQDLQYIYDFHWVCSAVLDQQDRRASDTCKSEGFPQWWIVVVVLWVIAFIVIYISCKPSSEEEDHGRNLEAPIANELTERFRAAD